MKPLQPVAHTWSSSSRFVIVCAVAVIGLADLWRMPYLLLNYGGGAFLAVYTAALLFMGLPLLAGQMLMARGTQADLPGVIAAWTRGTAHSRFWVWGAYLTLVGAALLLACYSVIAGWSLAYSLRGVSTALDTASLAAARAQFIDLARDPERGFGWLLLFFCLIVACASRGLRRGVEPVMLALAGATLLVFLALLISACRDAGAARVARDLLAPDFANLGVHGVLEALYQAFFTLSLGTGVIVALASSLDHRAPVIRISLAVIAASVLASAGSAFMLAVFFSQHEVAIGAGLQNLFEVLPVALGAGWRAGAFFILVALVSLSTAIGLFEPVVQCIAMRSGFSRLRSSLYAGLALGALGLMLLLSFGPLAGWRWHGFNLFSGVLVISTQGIIPLTGLMLCLLLGRVLARRRLVAAWRGESDAMHASNLQALGFSLWHLLLRYPCRIALLVVLIYALGGLELVETIW